MPAIQANLSKFKITTDYPLDKIVYIHSGSLVVAPFSTATESVAHGLTFKPLLDGTWSTDSSFVSVSYDMGSGPITTAPDFIFNTKVEVSSDATNAIIEVENITGSSVTVYYRIYGLEPSAVNLVAPHTDSLADTFIINSDFNYTKLFKKDRVTSNTTFNHSLGHRPQVSVWEELSGGSIRKKNENEVNNTFGVARVSVNTASIIVTFEASGPAAIHYRIYADE